MSNEKIACTAPGCRKSLPPEAMWLPERRAREAANGGKRVPAADFPKFALCGYHGHLLRKEAEIKVYRYADEVERERKSDERRSAEELSWKPFAQRFVAKTDPSPSAKAAGDRQAKAKVQRPGVRVHTGPGQGLSRLSKEDAAKRRSKEPKEKAPASDAPAAQPVAQSKEA